MSCPISTTCRRTQNGSIPQPVQLPHSVLSTNGLLSSQFGETNIEMLLIHEISGGNRIPRPFYYTVWKQHSGQCAFTDFGKVLHACFGICSSLSHAFQKWEGTEGRGRMTWHPNSQSQTRYILPKPGKADPFPHVNKNFENWTNQNSSIYSLRFQNVQKWLAFHLSSTKKPRSPSVAVLATPSPALLGSRSCAVKHTEAIHPSKYSKNSQEWYGELKSFPEYSGYHWFMNPSLSI